MSARLAAAAAVLLLLMIIITAVITDAGREHCRLWRTDLPI